MPGILFDDAILEETRDHVVDILHCLRCPAGVLACPEVTAERADDQAWHIRFGKIDGACRQRLARRCGLCE